MPDNTTPLQNIIPKKVINMAKAMQETNKSGQQLVIVQKRQWGRNAARKLANGEQILPTNLNDNN